MKNTSWVLFSLLIFSIQVTWWASQGMGNFESPLLRSLGHSLGDTALPPIMQNGAFAGRLVVALLSDLYSPCNLGHRLPYIVGGQLLAAFALGLVGGVSPAPGPGWGVYLFAAVLRSVSAVAALCAVDGLIVDAGIPQHMGFIQQVRGGGAVVGQLLTNLGGGALADAFGLSGLAIFLAVFMAPLVSLPLVVFGGVVEERERKKGGGVKTSAGVDAPPPPNFFKALSEAVDWRGGLASLGTPATAAVLFLAVTLFFGQTIGNFPLTVFLVDNGLSLLEVGYLNTIFALTQFLGVLLGGYVLDRRDIRASTCIAQLINAALTLAVVWTPQTHTFGYHAGLNTLGGATTGFVNAVTLGVALRSAPKGLSASFMAVIQGAQNAAGLVGNVVVMQLSGLPNKFQASFIAGAVMLGVGVLALPFLGEAAKPPPPPPFPGKAWEEGEGGGEGGVGTANPLALGVLALGPITTTTTTTTTSTTAVVPAAPEDTPGVVEGVVALVGEVPESTPLGNKSHIIGEGVKEWGR